MHRYEMGRKKSFLGYGLRYASQKEPVVISNVATQEWGVWEYWNRALLVKV
ncbi:MAG TPA: hypothetical protein VED16_03620 [Candidatus Acidoferrum sp.]|nr:hypothetical protein [Candidatus Acidoferrum sp.]